MDSSRISSDKDEGGVERVQNDFGKGLELTMKEGSAKLRSIKTVEACLGQLNLWTHALAIIRTREVTKPPTDKDGNKRPQKREDPSWWY